MTAIACVASAIDLSAQQNWIVKPEWVSAHESFLASDERSDNYSLALQGVVAHTAAGWGTVPTYHKPDDDLAHLDLPFMTRAIQSLVEPVRWLANSNFRPQWNPGGAPKPGN